MVKKFTNFIGREISNLHQAAYILAFFTMFAQILSFFRGRLLAGEFGASLELDVYYAAFRIPDMLFIIMSAIVSAGILLPYIMKTRERSDKKAKELLSSVLTIFTITSALVLSLVVIFMPQILSFLFPKFINSSMGNELILMSRIMCFSPFILGISSFVGSIIQSQRKFFVYAMAPVFYNVGTILGIIYLYPKFGYQGLAWGVVIGSLMHVGIQVPTFIGTGLVPGFKFKKISSDVKDLLKSSVPRTVEGLANQLNLSIIIAIAGIMSAGAVSVFSLSIALQGVTLALIGASYSLAAFPAMSSAYAKGDIKKMLEHFSSAARHIIFWIAPAMVLFIVLRAQVVRTIFGTGNFSWEDTRLVTASLAIFSISMIPQAMNMLFIKGFYSASKTWKPLKITLFMTLLSPVFIFIYMHIFNNSIINIGLLESILRVDGMENIDVLLLPLAFVTSTIIGMILLWVSFTREFGSVFKNLKRVIIQSGVASIIMGIITYQGLEIFKFFSEKDSGIGIFLQGLIAGLIGIVAWVFALVIMNNKEIKAVVNTIRSKIWRAKPIVGSTQIME